MIWGLGSWKGGTHTLAKELDLLHEPSPWVAQGAVGFHHRGSHFSTFTEARSKETAMVDTLLARMHKCEKLGKAGCVDGAHGFLIPLILRADPDAEFVLVLRDPLEVVMSLVDYIDWDLKHPGTTHRTSLFPWMVHPLGGFQHQEPPWFRVAYHWHTLMDTILRTAPENRLDVYPLWYTQSRHGASTKKRPNLPGYVEEAVVSYTDSAFDALYHYPFREWP